MSRRRNSLFPDGLSDSFNDGDITATANTAVAGSVRSVISGASAIGNSASFHVSRPSH